MYDFFIIFGAILFGLVLPEFLGAHGRVLPPSVNILSAISLGLVSTGFLLGG